MEYWSDRTELLVKSDSLKNLKDAHILIVGVGGVGGFAAEMLCRAGIGAFTLIDKDDISVTNINRQIVALHSTVGKKKGEILAQRLKDINPAVSVNVISEMLDETNMDRVLSAVKYSYVVDAIDTITPKVLLIQNCIERGIKVVSSMGAGGKLEPDKISISDISDTTYCTLARVVRKRLKKIGIYKGVTVVYSTEQNDKTAIVKTDEIYKKTTTGTISYMPAMFGLYISSHIIRDIIDLKK